MTTSPRHPPTCDSSASTCPPLRLAILLSGGGRTLENLQTCIQQSELQATIKLVISSNANAYGVQRAANLKLPCVTIARRDHADTQSFSQAIWDQVRQANVDMVCLAGFLSLLTIPDDMVNRVINIHPSLLPSFGGRGMFGHHVHEAVLAAGCKITGCTVHMADQTYDTGPIIVQRACPVLEDDTPDTLAARVFEQECQAYLKALQLFQTRRVRFDGQVARILPHDAMAEEPIDPSCH